MKYIVVLTKYGGQETFQVVDAKALSKEDAEALLKKMRTYVSKNKIDNEYNLFVVLPR